MNVFLNYFRAVMLSCLLLSMLISCQGQNQNASEKTEIFILKLTIGEKVHAIGKSVRTILQDKQQNIWIATFGDGIFRYDGKDLIQITQKHGLPSNNIWDLKEDSKGLIWIKTQQKLYSFDGQSFKNQQIEVISGLSVNTQKIDLFTEYYLENNQVKKFHLSDNPLIPAISNNNNGYSPFGIYRTLKDSKGNIWFGTDRKGICKYDGNTFTWYNQPDLCLAVRALYEDKSGHIWAGNNGYGLFQLDDNIFKNISQKYHLDNPDFVNKLLSKKGAMSRIWAITEDKSQHLWVATIDNGIWMFDGQTFQNYTTKDGLVSNNIWTLFCDNKGNIWIGSDDNGISIFDGKTFKTL
ncbi:ligand-binding sensor domain-containing protein [Flectobacillus longus]|uniref:ligand-binding sensor domain-containing protein n=1 Tax=Flectobacillus longus TaxID=2984207 RepID=UPI0024B7F1DA|nr:two-component regulator propeller domain-containing protein [Flectobacillus longus]MDI9880650.1 two-component regulator propeller domain-containing protein [Flectobacillus longus]